MDNKPKTQEQIFDEQYNSNEYNKTHWSFSPQEIRELQKWDAIRENAGLVMTAVINGEALKRIGAKDSVDTKILYSVKDGKFTVYAPKRWCSLCDKRKAEFSYKDKVYCAGCIEVLKMQNAMQPAPEVKKTPKKKAEK